MTIWCDKCLPTVARQAVIRVDIRVTNLMSGKSQVKCSNLCAEHSNQSSNGLGAGPKKQLNGPPASMAYERGIALAKENS